LILGRSILFINIVKEYHIIRFAAFGKALLGRGMVMIKMFLSNFIKKMNKYKNQQCQSARVAAVRESISDKQKNINNVIENIIKIPIEFYRKKNATIFKLFVESDYCKYYKYIDEKLLQKYLVKNIENIDHWHDYSCDKRTDKGYYLDFTDTNYEVGYFDGETINKIQTYNNAVNACAHFIKLELEDLRNR
jgi:hypothetical protein